MDDPIVEEIHRIREEIMKRFNYDLGAYLRYLKEQEKQEQKSGRKVVSLPLMRNEPDTPSGTGDG